MKALIYFNLSTSFNTIICASQRFIRLKRVWREGKRIVLNPWPTEMLYKHVPYSYRAATMISFVKGEIWGVSVLIFFINRWNNHTLQLFFFFFCWEGGGGNDNPYKSLISYRVIGYHRYWLLNYNPSILILEFLTDVGVQITSIALISIKIPETKIIHSALH